MFKTDYVRRVYEKAVLKNPEQKEFLQAVTEVFESLEPVLITNDIYEKHAILERMVEPERFIRFRVTWVDDSGKVHVNRGFRVQFSSAIGPYKGGLRFHPTVNASVVKFLGFEQVLKNALTSLPMGGAKGGSDFDPKGKSEIEVMHFCQSFMVELSRHIGQFTDVPAGDIGVGSREIGYMYGQFKRLRNEASGVLSGKGLEYGGSLVRNEATGYGLCYYVAEAMKLLRQDTFEGKTVCVSGSGNVAVFAAEKAQSLGAKVVTMSDSSGWVHDKNGIDVELMKHIKFTDRARISEYAVARGCDYHDGSSVWSVPCDIALPCATENELCEEDAELLIANGCRVVAEGANMPCTPQAVDLFLKNGVVYGPGKAANAGGVAVSGLEMAQNSMRMAWSFAKVDATLLRIMRGIVNTSLEAAARFGLEGNLMAGANIAGFEKVSTAMIAQGISY